MFGVLSPSVNPGCLEKSKRAPSAPYHICYAGLSTGPEHARNPAPSRRAFALVLGQVLLSAGAASAIDLENLSQLQKQQLSASPPEHLHVCTQRDRSALLVVLSSRIGTTLCSGLNHSTVQAKPCPPQSTF